MHIFPTSLVAFTLSAAALHAEVPKVVTDTSITGSLVAQVMGGLGSPDVMLPGNADPHDYQLKPSQAGAVQDADLVIWVGPQLSPWLDKAAKNLGKGQSIELLNLPATLREAAPDDHHHEEAEGHDHHHEGDHDDDHAHEGGDGHDHGGLNPHAWLDPENARIWLQAIASALREKDPENAATYKSNADAASDAIVKLEDGIKAQLAPAKGKRFVVQHDAYGYFTNRFGLEPALTIAASDATAPSAARLREIKDQLKAEGAVCAFPEYGHDPRLLTAVTEGTPVTLGEALDPDGIGSAAGPSLYTEMMQSISNALAACLTQ